MTTFDASLLNRFDKATQYEWLETNGIGGYACSTLIGTNTRKYHGLLIAASQPPVGRQVLISKMEEKIYAGDKTYNLSTNKYHGTIHPNGYIYLKEFQHRIFPEFTYRCNGIEVKKTIAAIHGENTVVMLYEVLKANKEFTLELTPLMAGRSHHNLTYAYDHVNTGVWFQDNVLRNRMNSEIPEVFIGIPHGSFHHDPKWYYGFEYGMEQKRGEGAYEDLFSPGKLYIPLREGDRIGVILSTQNPEFKHPVAMIQKEERRRESLIRKAGFKHSLLKRLTLAGDQFLVEGKDHKKSIIAGYPWFCDWGRDTMISLPGLCLATRRFEEAKQILRSYAQWVDQGMIPNRFPETGQEPLYNTIDATLWYFVAVYKYLLATNDKTFVEEELMPVLADIIHWHKNGTRYGIKVDEDGLLTGGEPGVQLTWMDAKAGDWVVTPRIGKAVEINALWYNACEIFAKLTSLFGDKKKGKELSSEAKKMKREFNKAFWNPDKKCLYDYIDRDYKDPAVRPNQLFAISLPFSLVSKVKARQILDIVKDELFTPMGMRSLSPLDSDYQGQYVGDVFSRDNAYHKGTVWGWLIGPYIDALVKVRDVDGKIEARIVVEKFASHLDEAGIGSISEIFDGNSPFTPRGCFAQAWSIAELLRVAKEHQLFGSNARRSQDSLVKSKRKPASKKISREAKI